MLGIEKAYGNAAIQALLHANRNLMEATVNDALRVTPRYGKPDTLGLDAIPEISISTQVKEYDQHSILITEEQSEWPGFYTSVPADPRSFRTFFISDPTDRSSDFAKFLKGVKDKKKRVLDAMQDPKARKRWEKDSSSPVSVTGPYSAITCIRRGVPVLTVLINYLTQEMFLACSAGVFKAAIDYEKGSLEALSVDAVCSAGERIEFGVPVGHYQVLKKFVTFLGDEGKTGYLENFHDSHLMEDDDRELNIFYRRPGGPSRILYLSTILAPNQDVGFILANGEKITEWIHWLPFIRFARSAKDFGEPILSIYEIWHPRPHTKEGVLMSTSPSYSIFQPSDNNKMAIDVSMFQRFGNPSKIRSTLLVCLNSNDWVQQVVQRYGYRKIQF
jgi:hypothetical protein